MWMSGGIIMIANHENDYSCVITGSSVHNERIERLWRDVHRCVASIKYYMQIFFVTWNKSKFSIL